MAYAKYNYLIGKTPQQNLSFSPWIGHENPTHVAFRDNWWEDTEKGCQNTRT
jgi:hypothetical protein